MYILLILQSLAILVLLTLLIRSVRRANYFKLLYMEYAELTYQYIGKCLRYEATINTVLSANIGDNATDSASIVKSASKKDLLN